MIFVAYFFVVLLWGSLAFRPSGMQSRLLILIFLKVSSSFTSLPTCFPVLQPQLSLGSDPNPFNPKEKPQQAWFCTLCRHLRKFFRFFLSTHNTGKYNTVPLPPLFPFFFVLSETFFIACLCHYCSITQCVYTYILYMYTYFYVVIFYIIIHIYALYICISVLLKYIYI